MYAGAEVDGAGLVTVTGMNVEGGTGEGCACTCGMGSGGAGVENDNTEVTPPVPEMGVGTILSVVSLRVLDLRRVRVLSALDGLMDFMR